MATVTWLTVADVAERLRVSDETVRTWLRSSQMNGYNLGGRSGWRIAEADVDRFLEQKLGKRER